MMAILPPPEAHAEMPKRMVGRRVVRTCSCGKPWPCEQSIAERWKQIREAIQSERDKRNTMALTVAADKTAERCWGWADALGWVLALMDRPTPSAPSGAGPKE